MRSVGQSQGFDGFGRRYLATGGDYFTGFTSQWGGYYDSATSGDGGQTGLTLLTHRFYDPAAGRFLTRDPMGYDGGINLYAYTQNDPVNRNDPSGLMGGFGHGGPLPGWNPPTSGARHGGGGLDGYIPPPRKPGPDPLQPVWNFCKYWLPQPVQTPCSEEDSGLCDTPPNKGPCRVWSWRGKAGGVCMGNFLPDGGG
jgi:RHS repeat-associated protein